MNNTAPDADDSSLMWSLLSTAHGLEDRLEGALAQVGLSSPKLAALSHLVEAGKPLTLSELAALLSCVRSNITQLVDRLESEGLVRRVNSRDDRRSILAELTELGIERQKVGAEKAAEVHREFSKALASVDRQALQHALAALR